MVASWLGTLAHQDVDAACSAIARVCDSISVANPIETAAVRTMLSRRLDAIEAPRSWSKEDQLHFATLPRETQVILTRRENERDAGLRRLQNKLLNKQVSEPMKEIENGNEQE
jgi:hypothetical protein